MTLHKAQPSHRWQEGGVDCLTHGSEATSGSSLTTPANPVVPGRDTDPSVSAGLGQKALLAKRFAKSS